MMEAATSSRTSHKRKKIRKKRRKKLSDEVETPHNVFSLTAAEIEAKVFHLRYSSTHDAYYRYGRHAPAVRGWKKGAHTVVNMQRVHRAEPEQEREWAYLSRQPGRPSGSISWLLDCTDSGLAVDQFYALTYSRAERGGNITYDLKGVAAGRSKQRQDHRAVEGVMFVAYLDGPAAGCPGWRGNHGDTAHTQLFFQDSHDDPDGFPFDLLVTLTPKDSPVPTIPRDYLASRQTKLFPGKPSVDAQTPTRCTCATNERKPRSASTSDVTQQRWAYAQDEMYILESEMTSSDFPERSARAQNYKDSARDENSNVLTRLDDFQPRMRTKSRSSSVGAAPCHVCSSALCRCCNLRKRLDGDGVTVRSGETNSEVSLKRSDFHPTETAVVVTSASPHLSQESIRQHQDQKALVDPRAKKCVIL